MHEESGHSFGAWCYVNILCAIGSEATTYVQQRLSVSRVIWSSNSIVRLYYSRRCYVSRSLALNIRSIYIVVVENVSLS